MGERQASDDRHTLRERLIQIGRTVVLVGGLSRREKLALIHERFGLEVEWYEIEDDGPKATDTIVKRIKAGGIGAVILLEGLMGHKVSKRVIGACQACNIPYVRADRGGSGSLELAFVELDRKLSL
jgi:hypothetical protein